MENKIDITENIAAGNVDHIISILKKFREMGYDRLYWDGYDPKIEVYKSGEKKELPKSLQSFKIINSDREWDIEANEIFYDDIERSFSFRIDGKIVAQFWNVTVWVKNI